MKENTYSINLAHLILFAYKELKSFSFTLFILWLLYNTVMGLMVYFFKPAMDSFEN